MSLETTIHEIIHYFYTFFGWRDALEILFFSTVVYYFSLWLKKDRHKNLLGYFYAYCLCSFSAYAAGLSSISFILCLLFPCTLMLFMMLHQEILQKNFITLKNINPAKRANNDWIDILIRSCLITVNHNKEMVCIIEHTDSLAEHIEASLSLQASLQEELIKLIVESSTFDQRKMLWLTSQGSIKGINTEVTKMFGFVGNSPSDIPLDLWKQEALMITSKTDALVFKITPLTRTFDCIVQGKFFAGMTANNVLLFIKKYLANSQVDFIQGERLYGTPTTNHSSAQRSS